MLYDWYHMTSKRYWQWSKVIYQSSNREPNNTIFSIKAINWYQTLAGLNIYGTNFHYRSVKYFKYLASISKALQGIVLLQGNTSGYHILINLILYFSSLFWLASTWYDLFLLIPSYLWHLLCKICKNNDMVWEAISLCSTIKCKHFFWPNSISY